MSYCFHSVNSKIVGLKFFKVSNKNLQLTFTFFYASLQYIVSYFFSMQLNWNYIENTEMIFSFGIYISLRSRSLWSGDFKPYNFQIIKTQTNKFYGNLELLNCRKIKENEIKSENTLSYCFILKVLIQFINICLLLIHRYLLLITSSLWKSQEN